MNVFKNPKWIKEFEYPYASSDQIPAHVFNEINERLDKIQSKTHWLVLSFLPGMRKWIF